MTSGPDRLNDRNGPKRIMIVEDDEVLAQTTGWLVEMLGYDYKLVANGKGAIAAYPEYQPDVCMIDIGLPDMNGCDLCKELKSLPNFRGPVFIAQTGWSGAEHRSMTTEAGFDHHLVKPLCVKTLEALLSESLKTN